MSKNIYSVIECIDNSTGEWEIANLYSKNMDGSESPAQLIIGNSEYCSALFGAEAFDTMFDENGGIMDRFSEALEKIDSIIDESISPSIPKNASSEAKSLYGVHEISGGMVGGYAFSPECVTYTKRDFEVIELLAEKLSTNALAFYNRYFARIKWLLDSVQRTAYTSNGSNVRVIIWAV